MSAVRQERSVLWELHEGEGQGISSNPLPNLRSLEVGKIKLSSIVFPSLSDLSITKPVIGDAKFLFSSSSSENEGCVWTYSQFPKLEQLEIVCCSNSALQFLKADGSTAMLNFCGHLKTLVLGSTWIELNNIEMTSLHSFTSLRQLHISGLTSEYLFSVDRGFVQLQSLEELFIENCPNMKVIIQGGDKDKAVVFPRLKRLYLWSLERMSKFCSISDIPSLENLRIFYCYQLESLFCGEPNQVVELPYLITVDIDVCRGMKSFSTRPLKAPNLRFVRVYGCYEMEWFFDGEPNQVVELPSLEDLRIEKCNAMKYFSRRSLKATNLREVRVSNCPELECFLSSGNSNCDADLELPSLALVSIVNCPNMKSFLPALLRAPRLTKLIVKECNKWEWLIDGEPNQVVELPSLEEVKIDECDAMKSFSSRPLKAPKLRELAVFNCPAMECFLSGNSNDYADLELPFLEKVFINKCRNLKSFSPEVLRAPKLKLVEIDDKLYPIDEIKDFNHLLQSANSSKQTAPDKNDL